MENALPATKEALTPRQRARFCFEKSWPTGSSGCTEPCRALRTPTPSCLPQCHYRSKGLLEALGAGASGECFLGKGRVFHCRRGLTMR